jgi:hypothetical protein
LPWQLASNEAAFPTQQGRATPPIFPKEEKKKEWKKATERRNTEKEERGTHLM